MKKIIRLTEADLHRIIKESVNKILNEAADHSYGGETLNADNASDWIALSQLRRQKAKDANTLKDTRRQNDIAHKDRHKGMIQGWRNSEPEFWKKGEDKAMRIIPRTRPQYAVETGRKLEAMLNQAINEYGEDGYDTTPTGKKYVDVKYSTSDGFTRIWLDSEDTAEKLWDKIDYNFRNKIIGFKPYLSGNYLLGYIPYFDEETQKIWDDEERKYQQGVRDYYNSKKSGDYTGD